MKVLGLETATLAGGAALIDGDRIVGEYTLNIRVTHSERVMAAVDRLLTDAGWRPSDLEGLAVSIGPGSFTGLRIGASPFAVLTSSGRVSRGSRLRAFPACRALAASSWSAPCLRGRAYNGRQRRGRSCGRSSSSESSR